MDEGLTIDWTQMPTYNTIMSVAAGAGLLSLVLFGRALSRGSTVSYEGYAVNFGVLGAILTITGTHMTLTWRSRSTSRSTTSSSASPASGSGCSCWLPRSCCGSEPSASAPRPTPWPRSGTLRRPSRSSSSDSACRSSRSRSPAWCFQLFAAPPEEPISGAFSQWPWLEATFMSGLFGVAGIGAALLPVALRNLRAGGKLSVVQWIVGLALGLTGLAFVLFGAMNFFTHIGLIINTM